MKRPTVKQATLRLAQNMSVGLVVLFILMASEQIFAFRIQVPYRWIVIFATGFFADDIADRVFGRQP